MPASGQLTRPAGLVRGRRPTARTHPGNSRQDGSQPVRRIDLSPLPARSRGIRRVRRAERLSSRSCVAGPTPRGSKSRRRWTGSCEAGQRQSTPRVAPTQKPSCEARSTKLAARKSQRPSSVIGMGGRSGPRSRGRYTKAVALRRLEISGVSRDEHDCRRGNVEELARHHDIFPCPACSAGRHPSRGHGPTGDLQTSPCSSAGHIAVRQWREHIARLEAPEPAGAAGRGCRRRQAMFTCTFSSSVSPSMSQRTRRPSSVVR